MSITVYKVEQQVLNCCWDNPKLCYEIDAKFFQTEVARDIFVTIKYLHENSVKITVDSVATYGNSRNSLITKDNISAIRQQEYVLSQADFYFRALRKLWAKANIQKLLTEDMLNVVTSKNELDVPKLRSFVRSIDANLELVDGVESDLQTISQVGERYRGALIERKKGMYYSYGDVALDSVLMAGASPGQMTTIVGATGMGKSTLALNLFSRQINKYIPTMLVSLEMDEVSTMDRLVALRGHIPMKNLYMRSMDVETEEPGTEEDDADYTMSIAEDEINNLKRYENNFFMVDNPNLSTSDIEALIQKAKQKMQTDYLICTIDLMTMLNDCGTKPQDIEECMNRLSAIAKRQNVHIINIVQANRSTDNANVRSVEELDRLRPKTTHSIKNAEAIAERSRTVLSVFRKKAYAEKLFPDDPATKVMDDEFDVTVVKQSQGMSGIMVKYIYDGSMYRLDPLLDDEGNVDVTQDIPTVDYDNEKDDDENTGLGFTYSGYQQEV